MLLSLTEILSKVSQAKTEEDKILLLQKYRNVMLMTVLRYTYDENIEFCIPNTAPPWKKNGLVDVHNRLYQETRRLKMFLSNSPYATKLKKHKIEQLFIEILESIQDSDAEILANNMLTKKHILGVPKDVVEKAWPDFYTFKID